jgi:hypothetical protein
MRGYTFLGGGGVMVVGEYLLVSETLGRLSLLVVAARVKRLELTLD